MYAKCGALEEAKQVFDELPFQDVVSWNSLVAAYVQCRHGEKAVGFFHQMQEEGLLSDEVTFTCILKACAGLKALQKGKELHVRIVAKHSLGNYTVLGSALLDMYAKCGALPKAQQVFDELPARDVVSWNAVMAGYCQHECSEEVLHYFERMKGEGFSPDVITFGCLLKACGTLGAMEKGEEIHAAISATGFLAKGTELGSALVDMYAKCGALTKAEQILCKLPVRDIVSWNTLISGYCLHGRAEEALNCFECMMKEGLSPDKVTFGSILKACGSIGSCDWGMKIHAEIARRQFLGMGSISEYALVDMYAKCDKLAKAQEVFDRLPFRDRIAWTALINGYSQHGHGEEALKCFEQMKCEGFSPDCVTFTSMLKACSSIRAVEKGLDLHSEIARNGLLEKDAILGGALIDMYANCGALKMAREVFEELPLYDVVTYSALIAGLCEHGCGGEALYYFEEMIGEGLIPDFVAFGCVLKACGSIGATEKGERYFEAMAAKYGILPNSEHYTYMADILGSAGHLEKALVLITRMPSSNRLPAWLSLLRACKKWWDVELGREAFEGAIRVDEKSSAAYLIMRDIYVASGMEEDARMIEAMRLEKLSQNVT